MLIDVNLWGFKEKKIVSIFFSLKPCKINI